MNFNIIFNSQYLSQQVKIVCDVFYYEILYGNTLLIIIFSLILITTCTLFLKEHILLSCYYSQ